MLKFKYVSQGNLKPSLSPLDPITIRSSRLNQVFQVNHFKCFQDSPTDVLFPEMCSEYPEEVWDRVGDFLPLTGLCRPQGRVSLCGQRGGCSVGREDFLEALLILYKECTSPALMKIRNVANFVNKCKHPLLQLLWFCQEYSCGYVLHCIHSCL